MIEQIFKKSDKVFDIRRGWGVVCKVEVHFIEVEFKNEKGNNLVVWYEENSSLSLLSFSEYTLEGFSQERPEELPNEGDIVWIKEDEDQYFWQIGHFFKKSDNRYLVSQGRPDGWSLSGIVMTTKNPYANEK